jgi:hypothetical protein
MRGGDSRYEYKPSTSKFSVHCGWQFALVLKFGLVLLAIQYHGILFLMSEGYASCLKKVTKWHASLPFFKQSGTLV